MTARGRVFISYSSADRARCSKIVEYLESRGTLCWLAPRDILPGCHWTESIVDAIDQSCCVLLLLTANSNSSPQVRRELERAVSCSSPIVPFVLEEVRFSKWMQYCISVHHWQSVDEDSLHRSLNRVMEAVQVYYREAPHGDYLDIERALEQQKEPVDIADGSIVSEIAAALRESPAKSGAMLELHMPLDFGKLSNRAVQAILDSVEKLIHEACNTYGIVRRVTDSRTRWVLCTDGLGEEASRLAAVSYAASRLASGVGDIANLVRDRSGNELPWRIRVLPGSAADAPDGECAFRKGLFVDPAVTSLMEDLGVPEPKASLCETWEPDQPVFSASKEVFVGRARELAVLEELACRQVTWFSPNPRGGAKHLAAAIRGPAGIGKTSLVRRFRELHCQDRTVLQAGADHLVGRAAGLWRRLLKEMLGLPAAVEMPEDLLAVHLEEMTGERLSGEVLEPLHALLAGSFCHDDQMSEEAKAKLQISLRTLLEAAAKGEKLVLILEDLHRADHLSLEILTFLINNVHLQNPVLFLLTCRPVGSEEDKLRLEISERYCHRVHMNLQGLSSNDEREMLCGLMGGAEPSESLTSRILALSEGNPLYISETLAELLDRGRLSVSNGRTVLSPGTASHGLDSVPETISRRLEGLPTARRMLLKCLSVIGERFSLDQMSRYLASIAPGLGGCGDRLVMDLQPFVTLEENTFARSAAFGHSLYREACYRSISEDALPVLHRIAADSMEESGLGEHDPLSLAKHRHLSGQQKEALRWGMRAVAMARSLHSPKDVLDVCETLSSWMDLSSDGDISPGQRLEVTHAVCASLQEMGQLEEAGANVRRLRVLANQADIPEWMARVAIMEGKLLIATGDASVAAETLEAALEEVEALEDPGMLCRCLLSLSNSRKQLGDIESAMELLAKAEKIAVSCGKPSLSCAVLLRRGALLAGTGRQHEAMEAYGNAGKLAGSAHLPVTEMSVHRMMGKSQAEIGDWDQAGKSYSRALQLSRALGRRRSEATILNYMAYVQGNRGSVEQALNTDGKALALMKEVGDKHGVGRILLDMGGLLTRAGRSEEAAASLEEAVEIGRRSGIVGLEGAALSNLSTLYKDIGRLDEACTMASRALELWRSVGDRSRQGKMSSNLGSILERMGRNEEAEECFKDGIKLARECGDRMGECIRTGNLGVMYQIQHRWEEAESSYTGALELAEELDSDRFRGIMLSQLAALDDTLGRRERALERYQRAISLHERTGDRRQQQLTLGNMADLLRKQDRLEDAGELLKRRLSMCRQMESRDGEAAALCSMGVIMAKTQRLEEAADYYSSACAIAEEVGLGVHMLRGIAPLYRKLDAEGFPQAREHWPTHWDDPEEIVRDSHVEI